MFKIIAVALATLAVLAALVSAEVVELTADNFDQIVMDPTKDVLVSFTASWCGHCVRMKPAYKELSDSGLPESVVIANIDAATHQAVAGKYGVRGFPTIKFFAKNDKSGKAYQGARTVEAFKSFIQSNI